MFHVEHRRGQRMPQQPQNPTGFLVIQLKVGDAVTIGNDVIVVIKERRGDFIRLAIKAPKTTRLERVHAGPVVKA